jgi:hypothetical protein
MKQKTNAEGPLTVDPLTKVNDLTQLHRFAILCSEMRQDTRAKANILVKIALREAISTEFKLWRLSVCKVCIEDSKGVQISNMMSAHLVSPNEELDLKFKHYIAIVSCIKSGDKLSGGHRVLHLHLHVTRVRRRKGSEDAPEEVGRLAHWVSPCRDLRSTHPKKNAPT